MSAVKPPGRSTPLPIPSARGAGEALIALERHPPLRVLSETTLPGMDAHDLCAHPARTALAGHSEPAGGLVEPPRRRPARLGGRHRRLPTKPFVREVLLGKLRRYLDATAAAAGGKPRPDDAPCADPRNTS